MQRDSEKNYFSRSPLHVRPPLGRDRLSLTPMHSPLVALEAVVTVGPHGQGDLVGLNRKAVVRGGVTNN